MRVPKTCGKYTSCIKFLECAVSGMADYIVSGDRDLISVGEIGSIRIITPAELKELPEL